MTAGGGGGLRGGLFCFFNKRQFPAEPLNSEVGAPSRAQRWGGVFSGNRGRDSCGCSWGSHLLSQDFSPEWGGAEGPKLGGAWRRPEIENGEKQADYGNLVKLTQEILSDDF